VKIGDLQSWAGPSVTDKNRGSRSSRQMQLDLNLRIDRATRKGRVTIQPRLPRWLTRRDGEHARAEKAQAAFNRQFRRGKRLSGATEKSRSAS